VKGQGHTVTKTVTVTRLLVTCVATAMCCCCRRGSACWYDCLCFLVEPAISGLCIPSSSNVKNAVRRVGSDSSAERCAVLSVQVNHRLLHATWADRSRCNSDSYADEGLLRWW